VVADRSVISVIVKSVASNSAVCAHCVNITITIFQKIDLWAGYEADPFFWVPQRKRLTLKKVCDKLEATLTVT